MAIRAFRWRVFVDGDRSSFDCSRLRMALHTGHICVAARQRQSSFCIVIEGRRRPSQRIVAIGAMCRSVVYRELPAVRIAVASLALLRRSCESRLVGRARLVAVRTSDGAMSAQQRKFRLRMIETADVRPGFRGVARFAAQQRTIRTFLLHARREFAVVYVAMAGSARPVFEMKRQYTVRATALAGFVALGAWHRKMRPGERKMSLLMLRNREGGAMKIGHRMATLAAILVRRSRELPRVRVFVAVRALSERYLVARILSRRNVAPGTSH